MEKQEQVFCQSCGMPLTDDHYGKNADGSVNSDYCQYCFADGAFTSDVTMDQMIEECLQYLDDFNKDSEQKMTPDQAREQMKQFFPTLKRWQA